jgi:hypothetical protein
MSTPSNFAVVRLMRRNFIVPIGRSFGKVGRLSPRYHVAAAKRPADKLAKLKDAGGTAV